MKIWVVREEIFINGEWGENSEGYFSSRENAESAIRDYLMEDYPEEMIISAYNSRVEDDCGFLMTLPETGWMYSVRYDVSPWELDGEFGC